MRISQRKERPENGKNEYQANAGDPHRPQRRLRGGALPIQRQIRRNKGKRDRRRGEPHPRALRSAGPRQKKRKAQEKPAFLLYRGTSLRAFLRGLFSYAVLAAEMRKTSDFPHLFIFCSQLFNTLLKIIIYSISEYDTMDI